MKTQSKNTHFDFDRIKNTVFMCQLFFATLAFPVLFVVELTHKNPVEQSIEISKQISKDSQKVVSLN
jgi:hypothetical protein